MPEPGRLVACLFARLSGFVFLVCFVCFVFVLFFVLLVFLFVLFSCLLDGHLVGSLLAWLLLWLFDRLRACFGELFVVSLYLCLLACSSVFAIVCVLFCLVCVCLRSDISTRSRRDS